MMYYLLNQTVRYSATQGGGCPSVSHASSHSRKIFGKREHPLNAYGILSPLVQPISPQKRAAVKLFRRLISLRSFLFGIKNYTPLRFRFYKEHPVVICGKLGVCEPRAAQYFCEPPIKIPGNEKRILDNGASKSGTIGYRLVSRLTDGSSEFFVHMTKG